jgi:phosphohistidine phosphatase
MASDNLASVPEVDIDSDGTFKYVLIKVYGSKKSSSPEEVKTIVRGFKWGEYHGKKLNTFSLLAALLLFTRILL